MRENPAAPTGLGRRHRRLSDQETRDRMLRTATEIINEVGLTVSLDHISFEDVIRQAGVSRSTAYRHWPYKDLFFSDLVKELARTASPTIIRDEVRLVRQVLSEHLDWLDSPQSRHALIVELIRQLALLDFQSILTSPGWRTYLALLATFSSLDSGQLRDEVRAALAESEAARTAQLAAAWQQIATLFGYRPRPELATSFEDFATLLSGTMRGLILTALSTPDIATRTTMASPFGAADKQQWSPAAIGLASIAMAFLEPDPTAQWTPDRLTDIHRALAAWETVEP